MFNEIKSKSILILDFGSQYTQLIARRIRELGVYCEIHPYFLNPEVMRTLAPGGIILSGGPCSAMHASNPQAPDWVFESGLPLLGICYGMQTMAMQLGGEVQTSSLREFGYAEVQTNVDSALLNKLCDRRSETGQALLDVWMSHGDKVTQLPPGFEVICETANAPIAGMAHKSKHWYGLQFHPEVTHTIQGQEILRRFIFDICEAKPNWTTNNIIQESVAAIRAQVGEDQVLLALSGGVDSSVVAALLHQAIGDQLICVFVDTGLLRLHEVQEVNALFKEHFNMTIHTLYAKERFLKALKGLNCPEEKRKRIGHLFIQLFEEKSAEFPKVKWLAQGTIYPDVIESAATGTQTVSAVIKSHHNVGGLPETLKLPLLEPLRELFKDEVRQLGMELGLPRAMVYRHPFPGPGLAVRILGPIVEEFINIVQQADAIFIQSLRQEGLYDQVSQAFAVFLPVKTVGVMGDGRRYDYVIALRAVKTIDFMTAEWAQLPWEFLAKVSNRIINEVPGVSRVVYDISGKPPATIEWE